MTKEDELKEVIIELNMENQYYKKELRKLHRQKGTCHECGKDLEKRIKEVLK